MKEITTINSNFYGEQWFVNILQTCMQANPASSGFYRDLWFENELKNFNCRYELSNQNYKIKLMFDSEEDYVIFMLKYG